MKQVPLISDCLSRIALDQFGRQTTSQPKQEQKHSRNINQHRGNNPRLAVAFAMCVFALAMQFHCQMMREFNFFTFDLYNLS